MIGFLTGVTLAAVLAVGSWFAMTTFAVTSIDRVDDRMLHMEGVEQNYPGVDD